jgi:uncharacterized protein YjbI with pentapeptide repeats
VKLPLAIALLIAAQMPLAAAAFDEVEQTDQKRFKSMKTCAGCHLLQPRQSGPLKMIGANLLGADLRQLDLRSADLRRANMRGLDLRQVNLSRARLKGAFLRGADLRRANLRDASLWGADLSGADLRRADLRGADLSRANLTKASLQGADLRGVTYCRTILPSGDMKAPDCQLWNAEPVRNKDRPLQARSVPEKAKVAAPDKVEQRPSDGANFGSFLSRLFSFSLTPPAEPRENFN